MTTITTRINKDSELTFSEGDANTDIDAKAAAADPSAGSDDNRATYECTGTFNFTLPEASVIVDPGVTKPWNDYEVTIKNIGTGFITVLTTGTDTLDGIAAPGGTGISPGSVVTYKVNNGKTGYISNSGISPKFLFAGRMEITLPAGTTRYICPLGLDDVGGATVAEHQITVPHAGILKNLYVESDGNTLSGDCTVFVTLNSFNTDLGVVLLSAAPEIQYSNLIDAPVVTAGARLGIAVSAEPGTGLINQLSYGFGYY